MALTSINPATEEIIKEYNNHDDAYIEQALEKSVTAFHALKEMVIKERTDILQKAADILENEKNALAEILTLEMGKPIKAARSEVEKCAWVCRFYAENARDFLKDKQIKTDDSKSYISYHPIGPVLAVMPWNFPFWQVFRFAAPAIAAGNTGFLKHASNVPGSALAIEDIFKRAGLIDGGFQTLLIGSDKVEDILKDSRVTAATLTGSEKAGAAVAGTAGSVIKKTVLELGGSDPFIMMPSADIEAAVKAAVTGRTMNNGQSCIAAKRFIIHADIYEDVREKLIEAFTSLKIGNPMDEDTDIGPLAMPQIRNDLIEQVNSSINQGAKVLCGCQQIERKGYFYEPGLLEDIPEGSPAEIEELFGPVASLFKVHNIDEAISRANKTRFGLGAAIFTQDESDILKATREINAGGVAVNKIYGSDPRLPFGGNGISGYGRELADIGMYEFMNIKTIMIA